MIRCKAGGFYNDGGKRQAWIAQGGDGYTIPENVRGQVGWDSWPGGICPWPVQGFGLGGF